MKQNFNFILKILIFQYILKFYGKINTASVEIGKSVVDNECSSLGQNNPLQLLDCSIFKLEKGLCCLLTITKTKKEVEEGVTQNEEYYETACIILNKIDAKTINETSIEYKKFGGDVLIECSQLYIYKSFIYIKLILIILLI